MPSASVSSSSEKDKINQRQSRPCHPHRDLLSRMKTPPSPHLPRVSKLTFSTIISAEIFLGIASLFQSVKDRTSNSDISKIQTNLDLLYLSVFEFLSRPKSIKFATAGPSSYISGSPSTGLFSEAGVLMNTARPQTDSEYRDPITAVHLNINNAILYK